MKRPGGDAPRPGVSMWRAKPPAPAPLPPNKRALRPGLMEPLPDHEARTRLASVGFVVWLLILFAASEAKYPGWWYRHGRHYRCHECRKR